MGGEPAVAASGAYAATVVPFCRTKIHLDEDLLLVGLRAIYEKNARTR
jgi:type III pantothenate kinase